MSGPSLLGSSFGARLTEIRLGRDLSVQRLADRTGLRRSTIGRIERGLLAPTPEHLERLSAVLGSLELEGG